MRRGHGAKLSYYDIGATPFFTAQCDPRFSYCLYVPESYDEKGTERYPLLAVVHGTERGAESYRDRFAPFAEEHGAVVLAPLFPANTFGPHDLDNYKFVDFGGVRYDLVLLAMADELAAKYRLRDDRLLLHGFSGGGHFVHRFLYLHPRRVRGVSIGAPGVVTLLDRERDWWVGIRDLEPRFGVAVDLPALRQAAVQIVVGGADVETWEITLAHGGPWWMEGAEVANPAGSNRLDRAHALRRSLEAAGVAVRLDVVPEVGHEGFKVLGPVMDFFARLLKAPA